MHAVVCYPKLPNVAESEGEIRIPVVQVDRRCAPRVVSKRVGKRERAAVEMQKIQCIAMAVPCYEVSLSAGARPDNDLDDSRCLIGGMERSSAPSTYSALMRPST